MSSNTVFKESPLHLLDLGKRSVAYSNDNNRIFGCEIPFQGFINLRGNADEIAKPFAKATGVALPTEPGSVHRGKGVQVFWISIDEWLIVTKEDQEYSLQSSLKGALKGLLFALTDNTGGNTIMRFKGKDVRLMLSKGVMVDLHPSVFVKGRSIQTNIAQSVATLAPLSDDTIDIIVRRSFAEYVWLFLEQSAQEYGFSVVSSIPEA